MTIRTDRIDADRYTRIDAANGGAYILLEPCEMLYVKFEDEEEAPEAEAYDRNNSGRFLINGFVSPLGTHWLAKPNGKFCIIQKQHETYADFLETYGADHFGRDLHEICDPLDRWFKVWSDDLKTEMY